MMNSEQAQDSQVSDERKAEDRNGGIDESGKVDRIRDILFGSQMRDYDGRFQRLEEHLIREVSDVRADVQKRLEVLENFMKGEVESIRNRANAEQSERSSAIEKLSRDLIEAAKNLDAKINNLGEHAGKEIRDLREQLLDQSKALSAEIREKHEQMKAGVEHEAAQIRGAMTGREALAEMLSEVALRLKNEFRVPGA
jgi:oligoendopeptidase F